MWVRVWVRTIFLVFFDEYASAAGLFVSPRIGVLVVLVLVLGERGVWENGRVEVWRLGESGRCVVDDIVSRVCVWVIRGRRRRRGRRCVVQLALHMLLLLLFLTQIPQLIQLLLLLLLLTPPTPPFPMSPRPLHLHLHLLLHRILTSTRIAPLPHDPRVQPIQKRLPRRTSLASADRTAPPKQGRASRSRRG